MGGCTRVLKKLEVIEDSPTHIRLSRGRSYLSDYVGERPVERVKMILYCQKHSRAIGLGESVTRTKFRLLTKPINLCVSESEECDRVVGPGEC